MIGDGVMLVIGQPFFEATDDFASAPERWAL